MDKWTDRRINGWTVKTLCFKERYTHTQLRKRLTLKTYWTWKVKKKKSTSILKKTDTGMIPFWPHKFFQVQTDLLFAFYCCCNKLPQIEWLNQCKSFIWQFWKSEVPNRSAGCSFQRLFIFFGWWPCMTPISASSSHLSDSDVPSSLIQL